MIGISLSFDSLLLWVPAITLLAMFAYGMYIRLFPHKTEEAAFMEEQRKKELTRIVTERKDREITDCTDEEKFWELIESTHSRGKKAYLSKLRVLRDKLSNQFSPDDLIRFDNRYQQLIEEYINQDLVAASTIIFGERNVGLAILLMNIFMFEGEIFFKNACQNPNLIIGKEIERVEMQTID
jgi:hypothetical protein